MALFLGGVDDDADVWLNGEKVGSHNGFSESFYFDVTNVLRSGRNELVVRVTDNGGPGGMYRPVTLIELSRVEELLRSKYADLPARSSPGWVRNAIIYEVYLRSFSKEGTFKALERRLPELQELGVTVLWLMPIHPVGELNRKGTLGSPYAVQDYYAVNPEFGTMDNFRSLVNAVHQRGMKIIIDLVANHTAWDSKLIMEHPEWFTKNKEGAIISPNADWTDVADLNYDQHELRKWMIEMMKFWVKDVGIDGFRCDVAELVPTNFWVRARRELEKIKPLLMLSEGTLAEHHVEAFDLTYSWNMYDVLGRIINDTLSVHVFDRNLRYESLQFPRASLRLRFNTNHDKNAWDAPAVKKFTRQGAKATAVLMFTLPGVPLIYNGEEVGNPRRLDLFEKVEIDWSKNEDFRQLYQQLTTLRKDHPALSLGAYLDIRNSGGGKVYSFARLNGEDVVLISINFSSETRSFELELPASLRRTYIDPFNGSSVSTEKENTQYVLAPLSFSILVTPQ